MKTHKGWTLVAKENSKFKCKKCKSSNLLYRIVESSDCQEDINYWCPDCKANWWSEGSDY